MVAEWAGERPRWLPSEFLWVVGCSYRGLPGAAAAVRNLIGANMSFRRAAIVRAGGFDPGLGRVGSVPLGCEETDLCIRLQLAEPEAIISYDPAAVVRHMVPVERTTLRYYFARCRAEGRSKAAVTRRVGRHAGLASERAFVRRTLPAGVRRALADAAPGRAAAIVAGLAVTATGYLLGGVT